MIRVCILLGAVVAGVTLYVQWSFFQRGRGISLLVPFRCNDPENQRYKNWQWLKRYWKAQLPCAEIIMGEDRFSSEDPSIPFSKSVAVNDAASKAKGDVYVIVDADGFVSASAVLHCANQIREARKRGYRLWFVPYRQFFRLTEEALQRILRSSPKKPYQFPTPPPESCLQRPTASQFGHRYGAMVQIMSKEAFWMVGGWDPRFRGWGGEDNSAMRAMDTLYWPHKTLPIQVLHLWHPMLSVEGQDHWVDQFHRIWPGQTGGCANKALSSQYFQAIGNRKKMREIVSQGWNLTPVNQSVQTDQGGTSL